MPRLVNFNIEGKDIIFGGTSSCRLTPSSEEVANLFKALLSVDNFPRYVISDSPLDKDLIAFEKAWRRNKSLQETPNIQKLAGHKYLAMLDGYGVYGSIIDWNMGTGPIKSLELIDREPYLIKIDLLGVRHTTHNVYLESRAPFTRVLAEMCLLLQKHFPKCCV